MSLPSAVFLDTSILEGQGYNFESVAIKAFVEAAQARDLVMLLPHPTEQEVDRHMRQRAREAFTTLRDVTRKAPFLSRCEHFPRDLPASPNIQLSQLAREAYQLFLSKFPVTRLDYSKVDLKSIMWWYNLSMAPFGEKSKRKEFPDAFAIAMLEAYAREHDCRVAVVSADNDFKDACDRYSSLLYFKSLPLVTETLLADPAKVEQVKAGIMNSLSRLEKRIVDDVEMWTVFTHERRRYHIKGSRVQGAEVGDINIIGLGAGECTMTFDAAIEAEHLFTWTEWVAKKKTTQSTRGGSWKPHLLQVQRKSRSMPPSTSPTFCRSRPTRPTSH